MKLTRTQHQAKLVELFDRKRTLKALCADRYEQWRLANNALEATNAELENLAAAEVEE